MSGTAKADLDAYLKRQSSLDTLRLITCGGVDDGKSTLIGRMLYECQLIFEDQLSELRTTSSKHGTQGETIDFALMLDGLSAEREQGITIDVAYRYFATDQRKFIVADTPGHEQYTRNMVTGASTADAAIILIDARKGVLEQTRRHSYIASLLRVRHVVLAVNKMDLVGYEQAVFDDIVTDWQTMGGGFAFDSVTPVPASALVGDNIVTRSANTGWYHGPTILGLLNALDITSAKTAHGFRMPVQWVNRPNLDFRGYAGTVAAGTLRKGDDVRILPSGESARVETIALGFCPRETATADQSVVLTLDRDVDISRGDVLVAAEDPCETSDQFEATLVWMANESGYAGRSYRLKIGAATVNATLSEIRHTVNVATFDEAPGRTLELNDISVVKLALDRPMPFEPFKQCPAMGSFILIDRQSHRTVAAGMILFSLRRADNVHRQAVTIDKQARAKLNGHPGRVFWFTGLSGSGKSTIANALERKLHASGHHTYVLDGDNVRLGLNRDLGFTDADRVENIRRIAEVAKLMVDAGLIVMTAFISPFRAERQMARDMFEPGEFVEIHVDTPLEVVEARDPKGLYRKARRGQLPNFTGIDSPYEAPLEPEFRFNTENETPEALADHLLETLVR